MDPSKSFPLVPKSSAVVWPKKCPSAEMSSRRPSGRGEDGFQAPGDAAMAEDTAMAEQRSEAALPQAVPGPSTAREAVASAQTPFEADVDGQGDERRDLAARSRDFQGLGPNKRPRLDPPEADTHPQFQDTGTALDGGPSRIGQLTEAAVCQRAAELFPSDAAIPAVRPALPLVVETPTNELVVLAFAASKHVKLIRGKRWRARRRRATSRQTSSASSCCRARPCGWARACGGPR